LGLMSGDQIQDIKSVPEPSPLVTLWFWYTGLAGFCLYRGARIRLRAELTRAEDRVNGCHGLVGSACSRSRFYAQILRRMAPALMVLAVIGVSVVQLDAAETCSTM